MAPCLLGRVATVYFAVGSRSLQKASRSAASSKRFDGLRAMLVTDDATARKLRLQAEHPFDIVAVDAGASHAAEFEATRPVADRSSLSTAERWRNRRDPANLALRRLRAAKIRAVATALQHFDVALLMDADTYVCSSLLEAACAVSEGPVVAFVPVDRGREHAASVLARSERWRVPGHAVEANTGVVAWRNATASRALVDAWLRAYGDLADASGFLMDQPAFRAALHAARARRGAAARFNCRGHDRTRRAGWRCPALRRLRRRRAAHGTVAARAGGAGCAVLHSHVPGARLTFSCVLVSVFLGSLRRRASGTGGRASSGGSGA